MRIRIRQIFFLIGNKVLTGGNRIKAALAENNPVYQAYMLYNNFASRPSWEQLAVYLLCKNSATHLDKISNGYCQVNKAGENRWNEGSKNGYKHSYIRLKDEGCAETLAAAIDAIMVGDYGSLQKY